MNSAERWIAIFNPRSAFGRPATKVDSIRRTETRGVRVSPAQKSSNRGRPIVHTEPWAKITVVLLDRHVAYLDRLAIDIRLKHGKAISRAEIIRGLIEAAFQSGIDLSQAESIDTIVEVLNSKKKSAR
jgi:hypothetical protein